MKWIRNGFSIPFNKHVTQQTVPRSSWSQEEKLEMSLAIQNLLNLGAVAPCSSLPDQFISKIFLASKSNGSKRFILNLKPLNKFITTEHFKMEDHRTASKIIPRDGYLATIDLKEAYLLIPIDPTHFKYLRFIFDNIIYEFRALPYGLSVAPRIFSKIMKEVITSLRTRGYKSVQYLDDILCIGDDYSECVNNVKETVNLLSRLGFIINYDKSSLNPQKVHKFLGFVFDTNSLTLSLPDKKRNSIAQLVKKFICLPRCTIREFAQFTGVLVSACPAARYGWLYTKNIEREKYILLKQHDGNYEAKVCLSNKILDDVTWWSQNIQITSNSMRPKNYCKEIFTDASMTGWGAVSDGTRVNGSWSINERNCHINYLELLAVFLGLKSLVPHKSNCAILLRVDNTTAISYINRMGGIQYPHLNDITRQIWQWCEKRQIWLFASYINTRDNKEADEESRKVNPDIEWELSKSVYQDIVHYFGHPDIDLFASRTNAKCELFASWKQDPDAMAVDAFTLDWSKYYFYAFPPFTLILRCLRKIIDDKASGILVFPYWPSQPWFPMLNSLIISEISFFGPSKYLLISPSRDHHPLHKQLTLGAAKLCGRRLSSEVPQNQL